jgi:hypothetical protein
MHLLNFRFALILGALFAPSSSPSPLTTKGDIYTYSTADARLPVGTDAQCLTALASETTGLKWASCSSGGGLTQPQVMAVSTARY